VRGIQSADQRSCYTFAYNLSTLVERFFLVHGATVLRA
jgi:hypothetical protein